MWEARMPDVEQVEWEREVMEFRGSFSTWVKGRDLEKQLRYGNDHGEEVCSVSPARRKQANRERV